MKVYKVILKSLEQLSLDLVIKQIFPWFFLPVFSSLSGGRRLLRAVAGNNPFFFSILLLSSVSSCFICLCFHGRGELSLIRHGSDLVSSVQLLTSRELAQGWEIACSCMRLGYMCGQLFFLVQVPDLQRSLLVACVVSLGGGCQLILHHPSRGNTSGVDKCSVHERLLYR